MSKLRNRSRWVVSLAVVGTLVLAMSGVAIAEGITIPGTDITVPVPDVVPSEVTQVVQTVTGSLPIPELPLPGTEVVQGVINNVTAPLNSLPTPDIAGQLPGTNSLPLSADALSGLPVGAESLNLLDPSNLPSAGALTDLLDPSQLPLPALPTLGDLPVIGTLLDILNPANLPGLDQLPIISAVLPIIDSVLEKLAEIPILKPIVEILEKVLVILRPVKPTPTPETPEAPTTPSASIVPTATVAGVESPAGESFDHLPYTGADLTGLIFLIACLLVSVLLVHKVEGSVRKTEFKKSGV